MPRVHGNPSAERRSAGPSRDGCDISLEQERDAREQDAILVQEEPLDEQRALVVQGQLPPMGNDHLGHEDVDHDVGVHREPPHLVQHGTGEVSEGRFHDVERHVEPEVEP